MVIRPQICTNLPERYNKQLTQMLKTSQDDLLFFTSGQELMNGFYQTGTQYGSITDEIELLMPGIA